MKTPEVVNGFGSFLYGVNLGLKNYEVLLRRNQFWRQRLRQNMAIHFRFQFSVVKHIYEILNIFIFERV